jgi:hypothetical protein
MFKNVEIKPDFAIIAAEDIGTVEDEVKILVGIR